MREARYRPLHPVTLIFVALAAGAGLFLAYEVASTFLIVFAGIMLAAVLDAGIAALRKIVALPRIALLGIVSITMLALLGAALAWGGVSLVSQARDFAVSAGEQLEVIGERLEEYGISLDAMTNGEGLSGLIDFLPTPEALFGHAQTFLGLATGALGGAVVILFLGLFFAANPTAYRDGFCRLLPVKHRARVAEVLGEAGHSLRWWLVGQLAMMIVVAISIAAMLMIMGIPNAILLGVIAGLLNFIPYLGPILAFIPVFLAILPEGMTTILLVSTLFIIIQSIEGYLIAPLIQERAVHLPPAWSLAGLVAFGSLFGGLGVALATPVMAVARILMLRLYVEDGLEGGQKRDAAASP